MRQLRFRTVAVVVAALVVTEFLEPVAHLGVAVFVRLAGALALWLVGELPAQSRLRQRWGECAGSLVLVVWVLALLELHGGASSVLMPFVPALGVAVAVLFESRRSTVLLSHGVLLGGLALVFWADGAPAETYARWLPAVAMLGVAGAVGVAESGKVRAQLIETLERGEAAIEQERALRLELEAQRTHAEKSEHLALLGQLAAGVAHEVNNPLAVVKANLEYVAAEVQPRPDSSATPAELGELFSDTASALERIRLVVVQLKAFAQEAPPAREAVAVEQLLADAMGLAALRVKPPIALRSSFTAPLPAIAVDPERLTHVLVGLVLNAAQALESQKPARSSPVVEVAATARDWALVLEVSDNGPGFAPEVLERVFTPFLTTKTDGAGMGLTLSIARRYVRSLGGDVQAENRPEGGARVRVVLPVAG